ncbi:MAG: hypothetical protein GY754_08235 [bacterium]|nr:hypothetical protein [bacterium]
MKKNTFRVKLILTLMAISFIFTGVDLLAVKQEKSEAVKYIETIGGISQAIQKDIWEYVKTAAHDKNRQLVLKRRIEVVLSINKSIKQVKKIKSFKGNDTYKNAVLKYLNILLSISTEDYAKIVDMEEVAEQSYDRMEAYMLAKEKANEKLNEATEELSEHEKKFAKENNVRLIKQETETTKRLILSGKVFSYDKIIYLIFFKSSKQELYLLDSLNRIDINKIEQNRLTLLKYAKQGLDDLDDVDEYEDDDSIKESCENMLEFYEEEADDRVPVLLDFFMKKEKFEKIKKAFELKPKSERKQEDVDLFNENVEAVNDALKEFNTINQELNNKRMKLVHDWNKKRSAFFDKHIPE